MVFIYSLHVNVYSNMELSLFFFEIIWVFRFISFVLMSSSLGFWYRLDSIKREANTKINTTKNNDPNHHH